MNSNRFFRLVLGIIFAVSAAGIVNPTAAQDEKKTEEPKPLAVGDQATDFELEGLDGKVKLSERFGEDGKPVVLLFSRANW